MTIIKFQPSQEGKIAAKGIVRNVFFEYMTKAEAKAHAVEVQEIELLHAIKTEKGSYVLIIRATIDGKCADVWRRIRDDEIDKIGKRPVADAFLTRLWGDGFINRWQKSECHIVRPAGS